MCSTLESNSAASSFHRKGTPQLIAARPRRRGACCLMVLLDPGSAAGEPAVLGWSRPSTAPTLPVSGQPRVVILVLHPGRRSATTLATGLVGKGLHGPGHPFAIPGAHHHTHIIHLRVAAGDISRVRVVSASPRWSRGGPTGPTPSHAIPRHPTPPHPRTAPKRPRNGLHTTLEL